MYKSQFRDRVTRSEFTLPIVLVLSITLWLTLGSFVVDIVDAALSCAAACVSAFVIMEWANSNALLRIRSRLITACFMLLLAAFPFLHIWDATLLVLLCLTLSYTFLFQAYQRGNAAVAVFHTFFFLGVGSIFYAQAAYLALPMLISLSSLQLRALNLRTFSAALIGLLTPYWLWLAYAVWDGTAAEMLSGLLERFAWVPADYSQISIPQWASAAFVIFYALIATCHFVRTAFNDKIRTRMYFYVLILQEVCLLALLLLFPQEFDTALCLLVFCTSPFIAHYFALSRGRMMDWWFVITLIALLLLATYNYYTLWML